MFIYCSNLDTIRMSYYYIFLYFYILYFIFFVISVEFLKVVRVRYSLLLFKLNNMVEYPFFSEKCNYITKKIIF